VGSDERAGKLLGSGRSENVSALVAELAGQQQRLGDGDGSSEGGSLGSGRDAGERGRGGGGVDRDVDDLQSRVLSLEFIRA